MRRNRQHCSAYGGPSPDNVPADQVMEGFVLRVLAGLVDRYDIFVFIIEYSQRSEIRKCLCHPQIRPPSR